MKVKLEACPDQSVQLKRCWKITRHCVFRAMTVFYSKGVTESLVYQFFQIAHPKERQGIRLADIRSAIKENQDLKKLLEDIGIPKEQLVTYVNLLISCYKTPQRRKAKTKSSKRL